MNEGGFGYLFEVTRTSTQIKKLTITNPFYPPCLGSQDTEFTTERSRVCKLVKWEVHSLVLFLHPRFFFSVGHFNTTFGCRKPLVSSIKVYSLKKHTNSEYLIVVKDLDGMSLDVLFFSKVNVSRVFTTSVYHGGSLITVLFNTFEFL